MPFYICLNSQNICGNICGLKSWADYMFSTLESMPEEIHIPVTDVNIEAMMVVSGHGDVILDEDDGIYKKGDSLKSFHHQARQPISRQALLAGFISIWLKKCRVPSLSHDGILSTVLFPAIQLVYGHALGILLAMVCCIQHVL